MIEVLLTQGEYSVYGIVGLVRVESREWLDAQWADFVEWAVAEKEAGRYNGRHEFLNWIKSRGAVELAQWEAHLGDYPIERGETLTWTEVAP